MFLPQWLKDLSNQKKGQGNMTNFSPIKYEYSIILICYMGKDAFQQCLNLHKWPIKTLQSYFMQTLQAKFYPLNPLVIVGKGSINLESKFSGTKSLPPLLIFHFGQNPCQCILLLLFLIMREQGLSHGMMNRLKGAQ